MRRAIVGVVTQILPRTPAASPPATRSAAPRTQALFITRKWPPAVGGMETYSERLCAELGSRCALSVIALPGRADGSPPTMPSLAIFGAKAAWSVMTTGAKRDVIHGGDLAIWPLVFLARLRHPKARVVLSAHGTDIALAFRRGFIARAYRAYLRIGRRLLPDCSILANSRATAGLVGRVGFRGVTVVRLGADKPVDATPTTPEPYVLFAGRLTKQKGCSWFIEHVLPGLDPEIQLKVAGTIRDASEREALNHPRVEFLGPVTGEALVELRRAALAVVAPNVASGEDGFEGFGLAAVEGAAHGGVVVASRYHGMEDAVIDGVTGFLEKSGDAEAWRRRLIGIAAWTPARRRRFLKNAKLAIESDYSWRRVAEETLAIYEHARSDGSVHGGP